MRLNDNQTSDSTPIQPQLESLEKRKLPSFKETPLGSPKEHMTNVNPNSKEEDRSKEYAEDEEDDPECPVVVLSKEEY